MGRDAAAVLTNPDAGFIRLVAEDRVPGRGDEPQPAIDDDAGFERVTMVAPDLGLIEAQAIGDGHAVAGLDPRGRQAPSRRIGERHID
jgi:hypothetical protein